mmetsp:Transcript_50450/g.118733  ORF Transcript_50450/g.118733 Transcript_50450/m.118733 type:complete len:200 (-) Transcript_50450:252-851(-)
MQPFADFVLHFLELLVRSLEQPLQRVDAKEEPIALVLDGDVDATVHALLLPLPYRIFVLHVALLEVQKVYQVRVLCFDAEHLKLHLHLPPPSQPARKHVDGLVKARLFEHQCRAVPARVHVILPRSLAHRVQKLQQNVLFRHLLFALGLCDWGLGAPCRLGPPHLHSVDVGQCPGVRLGGLVEGVMELQFAALVVQRTH